MPKSLLACLAGRRTESHPAAVLGEAIDGPVEARVTPLAAHAQIRHAVAVADRVLPPGTAEDSGDGSGRLVELLLVCDPETTVGQFVTLGHGFGLGIRQVAAVAEVEVDEHLGEWREDRLSQEFPLLG